MRVFVTGASGFIGTAVVVELLAHGHTALGLARSAASAATVAALGAEALQGALEDLELLARAARECDGVIHLAFNHDDFAPAKYAESCAAEEAAIRAMGKELLGTSKPMVITNGIAMLMKRPDEAASEEAEEVPGFPRTGALAARELAAQGVRCSCVRLPPSVHGAGDKGFVPMLGAVAKAKGVSAFVGDGANRWPATHRLDAAAAYRLALERGEPATYHAVAEEGVPFKAIAEAMAERLGLPSRAVAAEAAVEHFGPFFAMFAARDCAASSAWTRATLGWAPSGPSLVDDIKQHYFADAAAAAAAGKQE